MKFLISLCAIVVLNLFACAQSPCPGAVQWQQSYGGNNLDILSRVCPTSDGGFVVLGWSDVQSFGGNKASTNYGRDDFWVLRLDASGNKVWETSLGGSQIEFSGDIQQTTDGGFILVGSSNSQTDGTKTSPNQGLPETGDVWVIRLDADGHQLWDRTFGSTNADHAVRVLPTTNGGFMIGGSSYGEGGNKSSSTFGHWDYWLIALDADGNKLWERIYGGTEEDSLTSMERTSDGGFILCGYSYSRPSGNKTSPNYGLADAWVVRVDAGGNVLWQQTVGGDFYDYGFCVKETPDGGFAIGGAAASGISGNKDTPNLGFTILDAWLIKLDADGNKLWDRVYGGSWEDQLGSLVVLADGGFLLGAVSSSDDGDRVGAPFDNLDWWLVRTDANGNRIWDFSLGGTSYEFLSNVEQTSDGGFILGGTSYSPTSGTKTSPYFGGIDYWLVKLGPEGPCDSDGDGVPDDQDECPNTPAGVVVNGQGCSIEQIVPCDGPWKNHGEFVRAMTEVVMAFIRDGIISRKEGRDILQQAARSDCGKGSLHPRSDFGGNRGGDQRFQDGGFNPGHQADSLKVASPQPPPAVARKR
jgi:hypothetical protein